MAAILTEALLDALGIVVVPPRCLAALEQALQEDVLRTDEEENGRARDDLMMGSATDGSAQLPLIIPGSLPSRNSQSCQTRWPGPSGAGTRQ